MIAEALLDDLRTELLSLMATAVDGLVAKARTKLELAEKEAEKLKAKVLKEVEEQREALEREVAAMQRHQERHEGRVELDVGGVRYVSSVETLRRVPHTFFDAYFSGRYAVDETDDGAVFIDRDGRLFEHVLEYLRDSVVTVAQEDARTVDVGLLRRLKREFGFYSVEVVADEGPAAGEGVAYVFGGYKRGHSRGHSSVERYNAASDTWSEVEPMRTGRRFHCACEVSGELYVTGGYEQGGRFGNRREVLTRDGHMGRCGANAVSPPLPHCHLCRQ